MRLFFDYLFLHAPAIGAFFGAMFAALSSRLNGSDLKKLRSSEHRNANSLSVVVANMSLLRRAIEKAGISLEGWRELDWDNDEGKRR